MNKRLCVMFICFSVLFSGDLGYAAASEGEVSANGKNVISLCCEERDWYPFLYVEGREARGILIDIVREAVERAGFAAKIEPFPLRRCIKLAEHSRVDGVLGIPYSKNYARFLEYPSGAAVDKESPWRIVQIDKVIVTHRDEDYEFEGNMRTLPEPIRLTYNDPLGADFKQVGLEVEEAKTDRQNFAKLVRDRDGLVVTTSVTAEDMAQDESFRGMINIQAVPLRSRSFFLAFGWESDLSEYERRRIWEELERLRSDYVFMLQLFAQY